MDSSYDWKMTYNNPNHCSMMDLAHTPTRPPWRPAASSITAFKENDAPLPRSGFRFRQRSTELAVPPQHMSVTDLIAAMPKRHRVPKPQTLCTSYGLAVEPYKERMMLKTPYVTPGYNPLCERLEDERSEKRCSEQTPKSVLEQAARSVASSRSQQQSGTHGSHMASPPSCARSLLSSAAPSVVSEHHHSVASRHSAVASPMSQPTSPRRRTGTSSNCASPASGARSVVNSPTRSQYSSTRQIASRTPGTNNSSLVSAHDYSTSNGSTNMTRSRSSKHNSNNNTRGRSSSGNKDYPSRGTTGGSAHSRHSSHSRCSSQATSGRSTPTHRSMRDESPPMSGRCSPPTPPTPLSP